MKVFLTNKKTLIIIGVIVAIVLIGVVVFNGNKTTDNKLNNDTKITLLSDYEYEDVGYYSEGLIAIKKNGLWGYADEKGKIIIDCVFNVVNDFDNGFAKVTTTSYKEGIINKNGEFILNDLYKASITTKNGTSFAIDNDNYSIYNLTKQVEVYKSTYTHGFEFTDKYIIIDNKYVYDFEGNKFTGDNTTNNIFTYEGEYGSKDYKIISYSEDFFIVSKELENKGWLGGYKTVYNYMDEKGTFLLKEWCDNKCIDFVDGYAIYTDGTSAYVVDKNADIICTISLTVPVYYYGKTDFYDSYKIKGDVLITNDAIYDLKDDGRKVCNYTGKVTKDNKYIIINDDNSITKYGLFDITTKKMSVELKYDKLVEWDNDIYIVQLGTKIGLIDSQDKEITDLKYITMDSNYGWQDLDLLVVKINQDSYGIIDKNGKTVINEIKCKELYILTNNLFVIKDDEGYKVVNKSQKVLSDTYSKVNIKEGANIIGVYSDGKWALLGTK